MKRALLLAVSLACTSACLVKNQLYNKVPNSIVAVEPTHTPTKKPGQTTDLPDHIDANCDPSMHACMAFIEFDEMGEAWDPQQLPAALKLIDAAQKKSDHPLIVTFTHGWKNNAEDEHMVGRQNGNVVGFEGVLEYLKNQSIFGDSPVVGIYLSWRGDLVSKYWSIGRQLSYFNRENAAIRIPGASMTNALTSIMRESHQGDSHAKLIMVGHSFGGLILERALTPALLDFVQPRPAGSPAATENPLWADLAVFVNSAAAANEGIQVLHLLKANGTTFMRSGREQPLFLSISSLGDAATRFALPIGHGPSFLNRKLQGSWRTYNPADAFGVTAQSAYYLSTVAHMGALQSHLVVSTADAAQCNGGKPFGAPFQLPNQQQYQICEKPQRTNDTPYWAMEMPASIVPDHGGIFNENFVGLLQRFLLDIGQEMRENLPRPALRTRQR